MGWIAPVDNPCCFIIPAQNGSMRRPRELPSQLMVAPFTRRDLVRADFSGDRARRRDISSVSWGIYTHQDEMAETPQQQKLQRACALARTLPDCWLSHSTAAQIYAWPLPWRLQQENAVHLSQSAGTSHRIRRPGIISHRLRIREQDLAEWSGVRVTSRARSWLDMGTLLSVDELVVIGDLLVRKPYPAHEGRCESFETPDSLAEVLDAMHGVPGRRRALAAARLVRVGADSAPETKLRLALLRAGLPEPSLQIPAQPRNPRSPCADMGYPQLKLAIEYDGATHFTTDQARSDRRRDNIFISAGWTVLRFNSSDYVEGFTTAVAQVAEALSHRSPR